MEPTGLELLLDLNQCQFLSLGDAAAMEHLLQEGVILAGFDIVGRMLHQFPNHGITLAFVLAQSHVTMHTWPESAFCAVDAYACGGSDISSSLETLRQYLVDHLKPCSFQSRLVERGLDTRSKQGV